MEEKIKTFVYGSLKLGFPLNSHWMKRSKLLGDATTEEPNYRLYNLGWFPGMNDQGSHFVFGEFWEMPADDFEALASMEESAGYERKEITISVYGGVTEKAMTFIYPETSGHSEVEAGDGNVVIWD